MLRILLRHVSDLRSQQRCQLKNIGGQPSRAHQLSRITITPQRTDAVHTRLPGAVDVVAAVSDMHYSPRIRTGRRQQRQRACDDLGLRSALVIVRGSRHGGEAPAKAAVLDDLPSQGFR